jgi:hypothetical protein
MDTNPDFFLIILQSQLTDSSIEFLCWNFIFSDRFSAEKTAEKFRMASDFHRNLVGQQLVFFANTSMVSFSFKASKTTLALKSFRRFFLFLTY